jgi:hypothetical protein
MAMPREEHERYRELYLGNSSFSVTSGAAGDWTEIVNESTYQNLGSIYIDEAYFTIKPDAAGVERLRSEISNRNQNVKIRTVVNGKTVGQLPVSQALSNALMRGEEIRAIRAPLIFQTEADVRRTFHQIQLAGKRPPFPVEISSTVYRCTDGSEDEGDVTPTVT